MVKIQRLRTFCLSTKFLQWNSVLECWNLDQRLFHCSNAPFLQRSAPDTWNL